MSLANVMALQNNNVLNASLLADKKTPYAIARINRPSSSGMVAGGKTLWIFAGIAAGMILIGMALGLGLGIGAAGQLSNFNLTNVTNSTTSS